MKSLIKFAIEKDIESLETKTRYNGAPILRISSKSEKDIKLIRDWCITLGYSNKLFDRNNLNEPRALQRFGYDLFCVFGEDTINLDFYEIK
jgi:hypothetical protein